jgi:deoxyribose-phosphate aldolase
MNQNIDEIIDEIVDEVVNRVTGDGSGCPSCNWCLECEECRTQILEEVLNKGADRVGSAAGPGPVAIDLAPMIDHTLLRADATRKQIKQLCAEAREYGFASVCINSCWVRLCRDELRNSNVLVCTVIGFPLGAASRETKAFETRQAVEDGADEIDMVINIGRLKSKENDYVRRDIGAVVEAAGRQAHVKVILETCYLNDEEKTRGCLLSKQAGAHFVKTSTGFGKHGATLSDIALIRKVVGKDMGVKAAGGIRDYQSAVQMIEAGASRIGASASIAMVRT